MTFHFRKMLNIQRLAGAPKHRGYDLAQHSYFTTLLFLDLCNALGKTPTPAHLDLVLKHDFLEVFTADLPAPVKHLSPATEEAWAIIEREAVLANRYLGIIGEYSDESIEKGLGEFFPIFRAADILELWIFCTEEQGLGNCAVKIESVVTECEADLAGFPEEIGKATLGIMHKIIAQGREFDPSRMPGFKAEILPDEEAPGGEASQP